MVDAEEILPEAEEHRTKWKDYVRDAADIFHNKEGELFERDTAIEKLTEELDIKEDTAQQTLSALVSDIVDPVVQVPTNDSKNVGVVEYHEYDGAYGYREFDDVEGEANRVVCARCVETASGDKEVTHATSGSGSFDEDADFDELYDAIVEHYDQSHDLMPESVETGASLLSGTTIGGNTAFHGGNSHEAAAAAPVQEVNGRTGDVTGLFEAADYRPETDTHSRYTDAEARAAAPKYTPTRDPSGNLVFQDTPTASQALGANVTLTEAEHPYIFYTLSPDVSGTQYVEVTLDVRVASLDNNTTGSSGQTFSAHLLDDSGNVIDSIEETDFLYDGGDAPASYQRTETFRVDGDIGGGIEAHTDVNGITNVEYDRFDIDVRETEKMADVVNS